MGLQAQLQSGQCGVRWNVPPSFELRAETPIQIQWVDSRQHLVWNVTRVPFGLDVRREFEAEFRQDMEWLTRTEFENFARESWPDLKQELRTSDPNWSPVIEVAWKSLGGFPVVQTIRRLAYHPGCEIVVGGLLISLAEGMMDIEVTARVNLTGLRESILVSEMLNQSEPLREASESESEAAHQTIKGFLQERRQRDYDDPVHDERFPDHPLSVIRQALRWLCDANGAGLSITQPFVPPPPEAHLPRIGCRLTPPPRFIQTELMSSPNIVCFSRIAVPSSSTILLDVWIAPNLVLNGANQSIELEKLAITTLQDWKNEGVQIDRIDTRTLPAWNGRTQLESYICFFTNEPVHAVGRWLIDTDGRVFRITVSAPRCIPKEFLTTNAQTAFASWKRLEGLPKDTTKGKKWWQLW